MSGIDSLVTEMERVRSGEEMFRGGLYEQFSNWLGAEFTAEGIKGFK